MGDKARVFLSERFSLIEPVSEVNGVMSRLRTSLIDY